METKQQSESQEQDQSQSTQPNPNEITLVPYTLHKGEWTLPDHFLRSMVEQLKDEGSFELLFYEGTIKTGDEFVQLMQNPCNVPVYAFLGKDCIGFAWLNGMAGTMAYGHLCSLNRGYLTEAVFIKNTYSKRYYIHKMGCMFMDYWFSFPGEDGPLFEFLFAMIPGFNNPAMHYLERLGWNHLGSVPAMIKPAYRTDRVSAEIYYISRFEYVEKEPQAA